MPTETDIINFLTSPNGIILIFLVVISGTFIYLYFRNKNTFKPPNIDMTKETKKELNDFLSLSGWPRRFKYLRQGYNPLARIISHDYQRWKIKKKPEEKEIKVPTRVQIDRIFQDGKEVSSKTTELEFKVEKQIIVPEEERDFILVKGSRLKWPEWLWYALAKIGIGDTHFFIDVDMIENIKDKRVEDTQDLIINPHSQYWRFNGVHYFSDAGRKVLEDVGYKLAHESAIKKFVELTPLMTLLEIETARTKFKSELFTKLEKERFRKDVEEYSGAR